jgi:hypothetical protein
LSVRVGAAICGIIVAADNFGNVNVIVAEIVLTQVGSFMIYYTLVGFYQASYDHAKPNLISSAKYYNFWQGDTAKLVSTLQRISLYALIALAIASGVEGSNYDNPSSVAIGQKLAQAYGILCTTNSDRAKCRHYFSHRQCHSMDCFVVWGTNGRRCGRFQIHPLINLSFQFVAR